MSGPHTSLQGTCLGLGSSPYGVRGLYMKAEFTSVPPLPLVDPLAADARPQEAVGCMLPLCFLHGGQSGVSSPSAHHHPHGPTSARSVRRPLPPTPVSCKRTCLSPECFEELPILYINREQLIERFRLDWSSLASHQIRLGRLSGGRCQPRLQAPLFESPSASFSFFVQVTGPLATISLS